MWYYSTWNKKRYIEEVRNKIHIPPSSILQTWVPCRDIHPPGEEGEGSEASASLQTLVPACLRIRLIPVGQEGSPQAPTNPVPSLTWCLSDPAISCGFCSSGWLPITGLPVGSHKAWHWAHSGSLLAQALWPSGYQLALRNPGSWLGPAGPQEAEWKLSIV